MLQKVELKIYFDNLFKNINGTDRRAELHVQGNVDTNQQISIILMLLHRTVHIRVYTIFFYSFFVQFL